MSTFAGAFPDIFGIFQNIWYLISHGGWILLVVVFFYLAYLTYLDEIQTQFEQSQDWVFLAIRVPRENLVSTLAVEQIYSQLHALHTNLTFYQKYIEGKKQLRYSLEIVSLGGSISFIVRTPKRARDLVEAAFYAQYPKVEITETADYLENFDFDPEASQFDLFGTEFKLINDQAIPIKTYKDFEHPASEAGIVDPMSPFLESLAKMEPYELCAIQVVIRPLSDSEWKPMGEKKAKELLGEKPPEKVTLGKLLLKPFDMFADFSLQDALVPQPKSEQAAPKGFQNLSDVDKERINLVQKKIGKPGYETKIRLLYIAPKDKFDGAKKALPIGAFRTLGSAQTNSFKPDTKKTWTSVDSYLSPALEGVYTKHESQRRKKLFLTAYKKRTMAIGINPLILNVEEIATLYHLPLTVAQETPIASVQMTETKKSQAPANLPVAE